MRARLRSALQYPVDFALLLRGPLAKPAANLAAYPFIAARALPGASVPQPVWRTRRRSAAENPCSVQAACGGKIFFKREAPMRRIHADPTMDSPSRSATRHQPRFDDWNESACRRSGLAGAVGRLRDRLPDRRSMGHRVQG